LFDEVKDANGGGVAFEEVGEVLLRGVVGGVDAEGGREGGREGWQGETVDGKDWLRLLFLLLLSSLRKESKIGSRVFSFFTPSSLPPFLPPSLLTVK